MYSCKVQKLYHGTVKNIWKRELGQSYLYLTKDIEHAKHHANSKAEALGGSDYTCCMARIVPIEETN